MTTPGRNLERKCRHDNLDAARASLTRLGAVCEGTMLQMDVYFVARHGRLKLRRMTGREAELIAYDRPNIDGVRTSVYERVPVPDADHLERALTAALGRRGEVVKTREVWHWHNVRIHLDEVQGLGRFIEFEAVLGEAGEDVSLQRLADLGQTLELEGNVAGSYADLLGW